jgi:hypothetical protein
MFEEAHLLGFTERRIVVQTHRGRNVENQIEAEPGEQQRRKFDLLFKKHGAAWLQRKPACGVYNCAGQVWASRRTSIFEDAAWEMILADDGYRRLGSGEPPAPGDLVIYRDPRSGFLHVGMILALGEGITPDADRIPLVLSKWDSASPEVIHYVHATPPWEQQGFAVETEYWTDRPPREGMVPA